MKKLLLILIVAFSVSTSYAQRNTPQTVAIVFPFDPAAKQAVWIRDIIDKANTQQSKYNFVFESKVGAGGAIGARYVASSSQLTLLGATSSFWSRPFFYPDESHKVEDFKPVVIECVGQPLSVTSSKFKTLAEVRAQQRLTIGVNPGSLTEIVAKQFRTVIPGVQLDFIPYTGTVKATLDAASGVLDLTVGNPDASRGFLESGRLNNLGSTGTRSYPMFPAFSNQGIKGFEKLVFNYAILAPARIDSAVLQELHGILSAAITRDLANNMARDFCTHTNYNFKQTNEIFNEWNQYWPQVLKSIE